MCERDDMRENESESVRDNIESERVYVRDSMRERT